MNRGTFRGTAPARGDYPGLPAAGQGSWGGNRGRFHTDEIRMLGVADGQGYWLNNGNSGGARLFNTNPNAQVGNFAFPGDIGMVVNVGSGTMQFQGAPGPFSAAYNISGRYRAAAGYTGATVAGFENNTISDNLNGIASPLMGLAGLTSTTLYIANGAACTLSNPGDITSATLMSTFNGGTLAVTAFTQFDAGLGVGAGVTVTTRSAFALNDAIAVGGSNITTAGSGTLTNQYGFDCPILTVATTLNTPIRIGRGAQTLTAAVPSNGLIDVYSGTTTLNFVSTALPTVLNVGGTISLSQSGSAFGLVSAVYIHPTVVNTLGSTVSFSSVYGLLMAPTYTANTQTVATIGATVGYYFNPNISVTNAGTISAGTLVGSSAGGTIGASTTITLYQGVLLNAPTVNGTLTTWVGVDIAAMTAAGTNIGIRNASSLRQQGAFIATNNVVTVTSNAGTVAVTNYLSTFTNSSAATMAITMAVTGAVDAQLAIVRIYDFSNVAETIGWTNTENGGAAVPLTSNGSTTLPVTVGFIFNGSTSKWRCVAVA